MEQKLSEYRIVRELAEKVCQRIMRRTIRALQGMTSSDELLSGEGSGLRNTWEEICVQLQLEHSYSWEAYEETLRVYVEYFVDELPAHEREAIWLQTPEGDDWECEEASERELYPVFNPDIVNYITSDYVFQAGNNWSNSRIRAYLNSYY